MCLPQLNDTSPTIHGGVRGLSEIYDAEGQKGLDREVIRMLYEYAELRGTHKSLAATDTQRTPLPPMPSIRNIWIK